MYRSMEKMYTVFNNIKEWCSGNKIVVYTMKTKIICTGACTKDEYDMDESLNGIAVVEN